MQLSRFATEYATWHVTSDTSLPAVEVTMGRDSGPFPAAVWHAAEWTEDWVDADTPRPVRLLLRGPDAGDDALGVLLEVGTWRTWLRFPGIPERVVRRAGRITVT